MVPTFCAKGHFKVESSPTNYFVEMNSKGYLRSGSISDSLTRFNSVLIELLGRGKRNLLLIVGCPKIGNLIGSCKCTKTEQRTFSVRRDVKSPLGTLLDEFPRVTLKHYLESRCVHCSNSYRMKSVGDTVLCEYKLHKQFIPSRMAVM